MPGQERRMDERRKSPNKPVENTRMKVQSTIMVYAISTQHHSRSLLHLRLHSTPPSTHPLAFFPRAAAVLLDPAFLIVTLVGFVGLQHACMAESVMYRSLCIFHSRLWSMVLEKKKLKKGFHACKRGSAGVHQSKHAFIERGNLSFFLCAFWNFAAKCGSSFELEYGLFGGRENFGLLSFEAQIQQSLFETI